MLPPGKPAIFICLSIVVHLLFALLFSEVALTSPPAPKRMSLIFLPGPLTQSDIREVVWTAPQPVTPRFPIDLILANLEQEATDWLTIDRPPASLFVPPEILFPPMEIGEVAKEIRPQLAQDFLDLPPADSKPMPLVEIPSTPEVMEFTERR